jgi:hypothetical protein
MHLINNNLDLNEGKHLKTIFRRMRNTIQLKYELKKQVNKIIRESAGQLKKLK